MKSDRMRNKEKHNETEREEQSVREICTPSEGHMSHTLLITYTPDVIEVKLLFFRSITQGSTSAASAFFYCHVANSEVPMSNES